MIKPLHNRVLVKTLELPKVTAGGIHTPDSAQTTMRAGLVAARAEDAHDELVMGTCVLFGQFAGIEVPITDKGFLLLQDKEVLAITTLDDLGITEIEDA